jgi:hypothetical protein
MSSTFTNDGIDSSVIYLKHAIITGINDVYEQQNKLANYSPSTEIMQYAVDKTKTWISSTISYISSKAIDAYRDGGISRVSAVFDINKYRVQYGTRNELTRLYNIGFIAGGKALGFSKFMLESSESDVDGLCKLHSGKVYNIDSNMPWDAIPPGYMTHPLCTCKIKNMYMCVYIKKIYTHVLM